VPGKGDTRNTYRVLVRNPLENDHLQKIKMEMDCNNLRAERRL
jgi:hypothetical protein